jgi:hypothetical protein
MFHLSCALSQFHILFIIIVALALNPQTRITQTHTKIEKLKIKISHLSLMLKHNLTYGIVSFHLHLAGTIEMPKEDHGILIISAAAVVSFLTCLLCILCQRKRKRRHHRQLHRNAHYDSTTSATGKSQASSCKCELCLKKCKKRFSIFRLKFE